MDPDTALRNLELLAADGRMTNAGAWLLAKRIRRFHSSAHLSCALFEGTTKREILDRRDFESDVYSMVDDAMTWVRSKINVRYIITGSVNREERPELPLDAIREAVVNAVAHRDYRATANVQVCLYHDRLEIVSPGGLPAGMTEAELGVKSVPRNPLLFGILHRMDAVEHIGSGIRRIRDLCREWGVPAPVFDVSEHWVTVGFRRPAVGGEGSDSTSEGPGRDQVGTKSAPSRDQVGILRKSLAGEAHHGAHGGGGKNEPHQVQEPGSQAAAGGRLDRDDRSRQADQQEPEVSDYGVWEGGVGGGGGRWGNGSTPDGGGYRRGGGTYGEVAAKGVARRVAGCRDRYGPIWT